MIARLSQIWSELESESGRNGSPTQRKYRRLELHRESGLRLGFVSPAGVREMLIQVGEAEEEIDIITPKWKGMMFDLITLDVPSEGSKHIRLFLKDREHKSVFVTVCADLAKNLENCESASKRKLELEHFISRWSRFFQRYSTDGLTAERQRGLFGELWWLNRMIEFGIDRFIAVDSWRGCGRNYHDFEINGRTLEVKTTLTKEPRTVQINNERQLDDQGLSSLHLYILTLHKTEHAEMSLPGLVKLIRDSLHHSAAAETAFEHSLREAGYLDVQANNYSTGYVVKKQELFYVSNDFPRLIHIPSGVGDLRYSLTISACTTFEVDCDEYLQQFAGEEINVTK